MMKITLLTHFKEFEKRSNTGRLVLDVLGAAAEQVRWDRLNPPARLVEEIAAGGVALVYPGAVDEESGDNDDLSDITQFILIDGTWHEARKIYQRSPYLRKARRVCLKPAVTSQYNLRKNQKEACFCTAECVIEILRSAGRMEQAERLQERFLGFIRPPGTRRGEAMGREQTAMGKEVESGLEGSKTQASVTNKPPKMWHVYMILCSDDSLYTGITTEIERRFTQHASGRGARYFRGRQPKQLVYQESGHTRSSASRREAEIKGMTRAEKSALVSSGAIRMDLPPL